MASGKLKCAVVVPEWRVEQIFLSSFARSMGSYQEPSGPLYVAACLKRAGHPVLFLDGALRSNTEIIASVTRDRPRFVGLYACAPLWPSAMELVAGIRLGLPDAIIGVGGPWPMAVPRQCLEQSPGLDMAFTCEGEEVAVEVSAALESGGDLSGIPGIVYRTAHGDIVDTGYRRPIEDLDSLPFPARELLGDDIKRCSLPPGGYKARPVAHLIGSRGCTNRCIYCFHPEREQKIRYRSAGDVVQEMEQCVHRYGFREIRFLDDNFTGDRQRVLDICDMLQERKLRVPWYVSSRVDTVDLELLIRMRRAGCWAVLYGIETGVQRSLDAIGKGVTLHQIRDAVAATHRAGIKMFLPFMFGLPGETFEDGLKTIDFALELDPHYANFNTITPFPGTPLWEQGDQLGTINRDPRRLTFQGVAFVPHTMTEEEIIELRKIAFRRFYSRPRFILRWLWQIRSREDILAVLKGAASFVTMWLSPGAFDKTSHG